MLSKKPHLISKDILIGRKKIDGKRYIMKIEIKKARILTLILDRTDFEKRL